MSNLKILMNGIITENPTFVLLLGMCPTLGTTSSAINGMSGYDVRIDLLEYRDLRLEKRNPRLGAYPGIYRCDRDVRDRSADVHESIRSGFIR
jgi:Na+-translocating ferredoxin:NAD+ oxidoreductase RnfA subunit